MLVIQCETERGDHPMSQFEPAPGLPAEFVDLWSAAATATVTTLSPSGGPQTTATWFLVEDGTLRCSWEPTKQKVHNLVRDPRCTVMLLDPADPLRSLEIRAVATVTPDVDLAFRRRVGAWYDFPVADASPPHVVVTFTPEKIRGADHRSSDRVAVARRFLESLVVQRDAAASVAMVSDDFVSHDPNIVGREGLVDFVEWLDAHHRNSHIEVHHEFVSGDLVAIHHTDRHGGNVELAVVDILRVVGGRITEYWGVVGANSAVADTPA